MSSNDVVAVPSNAIVLDLLNKDNYKKWSSLVKTYLISQDLWDVVRYPSYDDFEDSTYANNDKSSAPKQPDQNQVEEGQKVWERKDASALHAIKVSCGSEALTMIINLPDYGSTAYFVWKYLEEKFNSQQNPTTFGPSRLNYDTPSKYKAFYKVVMSGDLTAAKEFIGEDHEAVRVRINHSGETALHVAARCGHTHIVKELIMQMTPDELAIEQFMGYTALSLAAMVGNISTAKFLVQNNRELHVTEDLPILLAMHVGHSDMARYLYKKTNFGHLLSEDFSQGASLLDHCILTKNFDIALDFMKRFTNRLTAENLELLLITLARCKFAFPSGTSLPFWQSWIYKCMHIPANSATSNISEESDYDRASTDTQKSGFMRRIGFHFLYFLGIMKIYEHKLLRAQSQEFVACILENLKKLRIENAQLAFRICIKAIFTAVEEGNVEFITEVLKENLEIIRYLDNRQRSIFAYAIECRQADIFNLIYSFGIKEEIATTQDDSGNTLAHMAGKLAPPSFLNQISGPAMQMQRELQWFKGVESIMQNKVIQNEYYKNNKNMTPEEYFTENHKELAKEGEKWMKETATNCTFVSALIVTVMFAAAFIVPGGTEGEKKLATISHEKWFLLYIISDAISLFSSTTSVLMFLGILTSRYYEEAFLKSLPTKLVIGLSTLFFSIAAMMITFCSALYVMLQGQMTILIPVVLLAIIPVTLFAKLLFPLLFEIVVSTYGKGVFVRRDDSILFK